MPKKDNKIKTNISLYLTLIKIGTFTLGGGYAMISILERDLVENKKWLTEDEMTTVIAIAESTPGPIAINSATYVGAKLGGFLGALLASTAVMLPSIIIIVLISLGIEKFSSNNYFKWAFMGIKAAVAALILNAALRFLSVFKDLKKPIYYIVFVASLALSLLSSFHVIKFDVVFIILLAAITGIIYGAIKRSTERKKQTLNIEKDESLTKNNDTNDETSILDHDINLTNNLAKLDDANSSSNKSNDGGNL